MTPEELRALENWLLKNEVVPIEPPRRPVESGPNPFVSLSPEVVVIARTSPAWSETLSSWELRLRTDGFLAQEWRGLVDRKWRTESRRAFIGAEWVQLFLRRADELDFWNLTDNIDDVITDIGSESLAIRSGEKWRAWRIVGAHIHAREGSDGAQKFMELWELISAQAPRS